MGDGRVREGGVPIPFQQEAPVGGGRVLGAGGFLLPVPFLQDSGLGSLFLLSGTPHNSHE